MKKMLVVGDSYSDHHEVRHCKLPSFKIWPEIISEKYEYNLLNMSCSGIGNQGILNNFLDSISKISFDIIIISWTKIKRVDIEVAESKYIQSDDDKYIKLPERIMDLKTHNFLRQIYTAQMSAAFLNTDIFQFCGTTPQVTKKIISSHYFEKISWENIYGFPFNKKMKGKDLDMFLNDDERISKEDQHPNEKGHQKMARIIENELLDRNLIIDPT